MKILKAEMKKFTIVILTFFVSILSTTAQNFMPGFDIFSHKKPAYVTLNDGTKIEGEIDKLNRKRNNISGGSRAKVGGCVL